MTLAMASVLFLLYNIGYAKGYKEAPYGSVVSDFDFPHWLNRLHFGITTGLIAASIGLWFRTVRGLFLSVAGLTFVFTAYAWWYLRTKAYLANSEVTEYTRLHDPYYRNLIFHGGTLWDTLVLIVTLLLFIWIAIALLKAWGRQKS
jgi:hypothetical protein